MKRFLDYIETKCADCFLDWQNGLISDQELVQQVALVTEDYTIYVGSKQWEPID